VLEVRYGLRVLERGLVTDSAGAGRWRGGPGSRVVVTVDRPGLVATALAFDRGALGPGLKGGDPASPDRIVLRDGQPGELAVDPVAYRIPLQPGDRLAVAKGGGPGFGRPLDRPASAVLEDVLDGYLSADQARARYGVVLDPSGQAIDDAATAALRAGHGRAAP